MKSKIATERSKQLPRNINRPISRPKPTNKNHGLIKTLQSTDIVSNRIPSKPKQETKPSSSIMQQRRKYIKTYQKSHHSISSKEDVEKYSNKLKSSNLLMGMSNCVLPTNYTDNKEDDKKKNSVINKKDDMSIGSIQHLGNLFRSSNLKRTIIIDGEGNNNLNLNVNLFSKKNNYPVKSFVQTVKPVPVSAKKEDNLKINEIINEKSNNSTNILKEDDNSDDRLKEYDMIFNLLNNNIEQMKNMFNNKTPQKGLFKEKGSSSKKVEYPNIISDKEREEINKVEDVSTEVKEKTQEHNSFLDSCMQDDFYKSLAKGSSKEFNSSFEFSSMLSINDTGNINTNLDQTECENDEKNDNFNVLKMNTLNPHFLLNKKSTNNEKKQIEHASNNTTDKKCIIF